MNEQDLDKQREEERQRKIAEDVANRVEELKKKKRGYDDTDEDDGYHD